MKFIGISALVTLACHTVAPICDQYDPRERIERHDYEIMMRSPVVVVGVVKSVDTVKSGISARKQPTLLLDRTRVTFQAENILRGSGVTRNTLVSFDVFTYSRQNGGYSGPPLYQVAPGNRCLFFLTRDGEILRSSGDVLDYTLRLRSGRHSQLIFDHPADVGDTIAQLLLGLGTDYDSEGMARNLRFMASISDHLATRVRTVNLLERLTDKGGVPSDIVNSACLVLAEGYYGHYACLNQIRDSPSFSVEVRKNAADLLAKHTAEMTILKQWLATYPLQAFSKAPFPDSLARTRQELELLLTCPDTVVRHLACSALRRNYPDPEPAKCNSVGGE